jgi:uncharacterized membrane protein
MEVELTLKVSRIIYALTIAAVWVPGLIVLVHMAKRRQFPLILLGLICMIYTYIWGWIRASEEKLEIVMTILDRPVARDDCCF